MKSKVIGQLLLMVAFILSCAGIAEPSAAVSASVAFFTFAGFAIVTFVTHNEWAVGYQQAQFDMSMHKTVDRERQMSREQLLFKCGLDGCACEYDSRYVVGQ